MKLTHGMQGSVQHERNDYRWSRKTRQLLADIKQACTYVEYDMLSISTENNGVDWLSFEEHRLRLSFLLDRQLGPIERASEAWVH